MVAAAVLGLSLVLASWAAALIVAAGLSVLTGVAALMGKREFEEAGPPLPTEAVQSTKEDVEDFKRGPHT